MQTNRLFRVAGLLLCLCLAPPALQAQFVVSDPIHTAVSNLMSLIQKPSFKTMVDAVEKLKKVKGAVQSYHRGQQLISTVQQTTRTLQSISTVISKDGHIYPAEYSLIADDLSAMGTHANDILKDMRQGTSQNLFEINDQGRIEWIFRAYESAKKFQGLVNNYYYKVRSMSLRRVRSQKDWQMTSRLYAMAEPTLNKQGSYSEVQFMLGEKGYDDDYTDLSKSALDEETIAQQQRQKQAEIDRKTAMIQECQDKLQIADLQGEQQAYAEMKFLYPPYFDPDKKGKPNGYVDPYDGHIISDAEFEILVRIRGRQIAADKRAAIQRECQEKMNSSGG